MNRKQHPMHHRFSAFVITALDVFRLLERASTREAYLLTALACAGARPTEIAGLCWKDVDLHRRVIRLGTGTKMERPRIVPVPLFLADALDRYRAWQGERDGFGNVSAAAESYLFPSRSGGALRPESLALRFRVHAMRTLGRPLTMHQLRRWALGRRLG